MIHLKNNLTAESYFLPSCEKEQVTLKFNTLLAKYFFSYFEVIIANTKEHLLAAQRVRHDVYHKELEWGKDSQEAKDEDKLDCDSVHILIKSKSLNRFVGTVRLCINKHDNELSFKHFWSTNEIDHSFVDLSCETNNVYCELSRLSVTRANRKSTDVAHGLGLSMLEKKLYKGCSAALLGAATVVFESLNLDAVVFMTESHIVELGAKQGYNFHRIGEDKELHGQRGLYVLRQSDLKKLQKNNSLSAKMYKELKKKVTLPFPMVPVSTFNRVTK